MFPIITYDHVLWPAFKYQKKMKYYKRYWRKHNWSKESIRKYRAKMDRFDVLYGETIKAKSLATKKKEIMKKRNTRNQKIKPGILSKLEKVGFFNDIL